MTAERVSYHHGDLRNALVRTGLDVLESDGIEAVTIRGLARRLGVSHNAPTHHFADRDALLHGIAAEGFAMLAAALRAAPQPASGEPPVLGIGLAYVTFALDHPNLFRLLFGPDLVDTVPRDDPCWVNSLDAFSVLARALAPQPVAAAPEEGRPSPWAAPGPADGPPPLDAATLASWALVHGVATLWIDGALGFFVPGGRPQLEALVRTMLATGC